jgi:hypothetical protein
VFRAPAADSGPDGCRDVCVGSINRLLRSVVLLCTAVCFKIGFQRGGFLGRGRRNSSWSPVMYHVLDFYVGGE